MSRLETVARVAIFACFITTIGHADEANDSLFQAADRAAQEGRLVAMQAAYETILSLEPHNIRALNGKATAQAWQGDYAGAQVTYKRALEFAHNNSDAFVGLGYAYAWSGEYVRAHTQFQRALRIDPKNISARKGIAYSYYWAGENQLALDSLALAKTITGDDAEIEEASGRVNLSLGRSRDAVLHFDRALQIDPQRESARLGRRSAYTNAPALELNTRVGSTSNAGTGIRAVEVAHWSTPETRFALRYDNSLGLDNVSISDRGSDAPGYFGSVQHIISPRWAVGAELGRRELGDFDQKVVGLQGSYTTPFGVARLGTQYARHDAGHNDKLLFGGFNFPLGFRWRIEPVVYLARTGAASDGEWRAVVNAEYQTQSTWKIGGFIGTGNIDAADSTFSGGTTVGGLRGDYLIADRYSVQVSLRREQMPTAKFTVAEVGFTYRLPGN